MHNSSASDVLLRIVPLGNTVTAITTCSEWALACLQRNRCACMRLGRHCCLASNGLRGQAFFIGLVEAYLYGWYIAVLFVPLYRRFSRNGH